MSSWLSPELLPLLSLAPSCVVTASLVATLFEVLFDVDFESLEDLVVVLD